MALKHLQIAARDKSLTWPVDFLFSAIQPHCLQTALIFINMKRLSIHYALQYCITPKQNVNSNLNTAGLNHTGVYCFALHRITFIQLRAYIIQNTHLLRVDVASWLV